MALLGNKLQQAYSATAKDTFNGDGSTVAFTLSRPSRTNDVEVFVENVQQEPTVAYAVSGTTLTFTEAPASGTGNIYVIHRTQATQSLTVNTDDIVDGSITSAKLAEGAVTDPTPAVVSGVDNTATDFFSLPRGTTAQRPVSPNNGYLRYNTTENYIEEYRGGSWQILSNVFNATGGTVTTENIGGTDYKIHTFTSSGTFEVTTGATNVEYLVVAGGGSGGNSESFSATGASGGGAGGYRSSVQGESSGGGVSAESTLAVEVGSYTVTIGAGGASQTSHSGGNDGSDSVFGSITSIGGGKGGGPSVSGGNGGSGGGQGYSASAGSGTSGQGFGGGSFSDPEGAGGGGAGAVGANGSSVGGDGGIGVQSSITGTATYYAGGGGGAGSSSTAGGAGGLGGGGAGTSNNNNVGGNGTANTGGGGGATGPADNGTSGAGGSGIVIIRYAV